MTTPPSRTRDALPDLRTAVELARVDVKRGLRWAFGQDFWLLYGVLSALGFLFVGLLAFDLGYGAGGALAEGDSAWLLTGGAATAWSVVWLFAVAMLAIDAVGTNGDLPNDGHYLTLRPASDLAAGKLVGAALKFGPMVSVPVVACYVGLAIGAGTLAPFAGATAAFLLTILSATAVGYPVGLLAKSLIRRSPLLSRAKPAIAGALAVAYFGVMMSGEFTEVVGALRPVLRSPPLGWLGALSLATTPGTGTSWAAVAGAVFVGTGVTVVGAVLSVRAARVAWTSDRTRPTDDTDDPVTAPDHGVDRVLGALAGSQATRGVANTALLRLYRAPLQLVFVAFPLVGVFPLAEFVLESGSVPWYVPWLAVWYGAWAASATLPLNPLGDQGAGLPTLLSSRATGRQVVHGYVLASTVVAAPVTMVVAGAFGVAADYSALEVVGVVVGALGATVVACVLAAGIGSLFPRFEAVGFSGSREAVPPSKVAYASFSAVLSVTVVSVSVVINDLGRDLVAVLASRALPFGWTVAPSTVRPVAWAVLVGVAAATPVAYSVARRRLGAYQLD
jgi:ABC-2 type transport system permease protein